MAEESKSPMTVVLTTVIGMLVVGIDLSIVAVAFTQLAQDTGASLPEIQWVTTGYSLALATVIPITAWAMNRFGSRNVFLLAIGLFTAASALVAASWNIESMAVFRIVQGLGGGLVMPAAMALTLSAAPQDQRGRFMAVMTLPAFVAPVFGPVLGGWLLDTLSWRWMFLINVPVGVVSILLGVRNLPHPPSGPIPKLDIRGLVVLSPAMALLIWGASAATEEAHIAELLVPIGLGASLVAGFVAHAIRTAEPLLNVRLLRRRLTGAGTAVLFLFQGGFATSLILMPLYWQVVRGESATTAGLLMAPGGLVVAIVLQFSGRFIDRLPPIAVIGPGITLAVLAAAALAVQLTEDAPVWQLVLTTMVLNAGAGFTLMPTMTVATRSLTGPDIPSGSAILSVVSQLTVSIGIAVFSVLLAAQMKAQMPDGYRGTGMESVSPDQLTMLAPHLAEAFRVTFWLPVVLMALGAIVAWASFSREPAPSQRIDVPLAASSAGTDETGTAAVKTASLRTEPSSR